WGRPLGMTDSTEEQIGSKNPFRYREYFYDAETGLYYVSSRYYDPEVGRFISPDDEEVLTAEHQNLAQYNLYAYCWNNPVNMSDENGDWPSWASAVAGVAVIAGLAVATAMTGGAVGVICGAALTGAIAGGGIGAGIGYAVGGIDGALNGIQH
ncbi:MAG: RHS repeat-associated core domain-containing protein, partial [Lachnospiraceae bacterium]|nr:RHS repeat-associated core domain-containing protein [Lachnospiraceae bacterium]